MHNKKYSNPKKEKKEKRKKKFDECIWNYFKSSLSAMNKFYIPIASSLRLWADFDTKNKGDKSCYPKTE